MTQISLESIVFPTLIHINSNIFGHDFNIDSIAFQQQDSVVSACATIALWTALQKPADKFGYYLPTPYEITQSANEQMSNSRPIPSSGLEFRQIINAIRRYGMEIEAVDYQDNDTQKNSKYLNPESFTALCYAYLRGGFPIFLGINIENFGFHAVTILGYKMGMRNECTSYPAMKDMEYKLPVTGSKITSFYIHDDNIGPFARFHLHYINKTILSCEDYRNEKQQGMKKITPIFIVIPLYHKIRINFWDIRKHLYSFDFLISNLQILNESDNKKREWDCYIEEVNNYKKMALKNSYIVPIPDHIRLDIQKIFFPRFIWQCTFFVNDNPYMEILADATEAKTNFPFFYLFFYDDEFRDAFIDSILHPEMINFLNQSQLHFFKQVFQHLGDLMSQ